MCVTSKRPDPHYYVWTPTRALSPESGAACVECELVRIDLRVENGRPVTHSVAHRDAPSYRNIAQWR